MLIRHHDCFCLPFLINLQTDVLSQKEIMHRSQAAFLEQGDGLAWGVLCTEPDSFLGAGLHGLLCPLAEHLHAVARVTHRQPLSVRGGELTCLCSVPIIHRLEGEKKPLCSCAAGRWHRGRHKASTKRLEDVFAATYSTSFLKAQLQSSAEAAVVPLTVPSLVLHPSAASSLLWSPA